jgi:chromosome segregation ATPase
MEESDNIILPILKEVGCDFPPTITSIKQLLVDEYVYTLSARCLVAINADFAANLPQKFPTSKATKFRTATEVAKLLKQLGYQGEVGYQSILYPHELEVRKIIGFLIGLLPKKESQMDDFDQNSTSLENRIKQSLSQINPNNNYNIFMKNKHYPVPVPFETVSLHQNQTNSSNTISTDIRTQLLNRPTFVNTQTLPCTLWGLYRPRLEMSTASNENNHYSQLIPSIIQHNSTQILSQKRTDDDLLPETQQFKNKIQAQLNSNLTSSFKIANSEAKNSKNLQEQIRAQKLKNSALKSQENVFTRKAQFTQENAVALASTEPIISAEEQLAQDKAQYEVIMQERETQLNSLQSQFDALLQQYKDVMSNIERFEGNIDDMNNSRGDLEANLDSLEGIYKTRCHVIDFLPNGVENIQKLKSLTDTNMNKITKLNTEWDRMRIGMINEKRDLQFELSQKLEKFSKNIQILHNLRSEIKSIGVDIRSKEDQYTAAVQEYESMPKSINRSVYIKRIMDIVKNIDKQNEEINAILVDIKSVQREITNKGESVKRSFAETDDLIYSTAKKGKSNIAVGVYRDVIMLRDGFNQIIDNVEAIGKKQNSIRQLEESSQLIQDRGTMNNFDSVQDDLNSIQAENEELLAKLDSAGVNSNGKKKKVKK